MVKEVLLFKSEIEDSTVGDKLRVPLGIVWMKDSYRSTEYTS